MLVFRDEVRLMAVDFANDPGVVGGATLSNPAVTFLEKRGEAPVADVIQATTPAAPTIVGTQVRVWCDFTGVDPGRYIIRAVVTLSNGETAKAEAVIVVE